MSEIKPISEIKNKIKRSQVFLKKKEKKIKKERLLQDSDKPKRQPNTIETLRIYDDPNPEELEVFSQLNNDFLNYFNVTLIPKVAITSSFHPFKKTNVFCRDLAAIIPSAHFFKRKKTGLNTLIKKAVEKEFTDLIFINDDKKSPSSLMICHLPNGPTAFFKILTFKLSYDFKHGTRRKYAENPEVVLNNFTTPLGQVIGQMFAVLFPQAPDFVDRRLVTFHNQRDYIFFRHHRYEFKNGERVALKELGPRFTLRLQYLQKGLFDPQNGEYAWKLKRHQMEKNRRKFYL